MKNMYPPTPHRGQASAALVHFLDATGEHFLEAAREHFLELLRGRPGALLRSGPGDFKKCPRTSQEVIPTPLLKKSKPLLKK